MTEVPLLQLEREHLKSHCLLYTTTDFLAYLVITLLHFDPSMATT